MIITHGVTDVREAGEYWRILQNEDSAEDEEEDHRGYIGCSNGYMCGSAARSWDYGIKFHKL